MAEINETTSNPHSEPSPKAGGRKRDLKIPHHGKTESEEEPETEAAEEPEIEVPTKIDPLGREKDFVKAKSIVAAQHWDARVWRRMS